MAVHSHVEWLKEGVIRWNKRRKRLNFSPDLSGVNFFDMLPPDYRDAPKTSRTFERIDLSNANLRGADLSNSNFRKANFRDADLTSANLSRSNFDDAKFMDSDLTDAVAYQSSFVGTEFVNTQINLVSFEGSDLSDSALIGSDISPDARKILLSRGARFFSNLTAYQAIRSAERGLSYSDRGAAGLRLDKPAKTPKVVYDVFFGTNRTPLFARGALDGFSGDISKSISYGLCEVTIPDGHDKPIGSLGSPLWKRLWNMKDDRLYISSLIGLDEELFFQHLVDSAERMNIKHDPTIFIHGFNNSFESAVLRTAQIGFDLQLGQGVGLFSWPSRGKKRAYASDERAAESSKYVLAEFISKLVEKSVTGKVNIIAHSMGCRCLLGALEVLSNGKVSVLRKINQIILAAADVDTSIMPRLGVAATQYSRRTTSYVSGHDKALKLSGWLHSYPRVGFLPPTFVMGGMDTVLVNDDDLGTLSHGYIGSNSRVLADIFQLLSKNDAPALRFSLIAASGGFWRFKN